MQKSELQTLWLQSLLDFMFKASTFFLHAGIFVGAALIGIARYIFDAPMGITTLMTIWSVALLFHGVLTWRKETSTSPDPHIRKEGVLRTVFVAAALNAVMWVMWGLATDARSGTPFHLTVFITTITVLVSSLILGKRMLYAHWLKEFQRDHPMQFEDMKAKRDENILETLQLDTDGEMRDYVDDSNSLRRERR
jgi:hypothetical protein